MASLAFLAILSGCTEKDDEAINPNLLFILTDEQRFDTSAPYGNDKIKTPNLNALGESGIVFQHAYVSQPVCSPARSTLMTGLYPHTNGVTSNNIPLKPQFKALPELVNDRDYATAYIGKWHLGRELDAWHGFDLRISTEDGYTREDTSRNSNYNAWLRERGFQPDNEDGTFSRTFASNLPYEFSKTKFMEVKAMEYLEENNDRPFILYLAFLEPHSPNNGPFNELHDTVLVDLDSTYFMKLTQDFPLRYHMKRGYHYDESTRKVFANYWGLVHQVDLTVGAVMQKLQALGIERNTIVVFTSEHGKMLRKFGMTGKTVMYEQSSRIPWILKIPGIEPRCIKQRVSQIDMVPTLLEAMNKPLPEHLPGKSLFPLITGAVDENGPVFLEWNPFPNWRSQMKDCPDWAGIRDCEDAVRTSIRTVITQDGWKLNWSSSDQSQLFHLIDDPGEVINLYGREEQSERIEMLQALILDWQERTNDTIKLTKDE